jgi:3-methylcrotonyl-CoA carboxylase alpha subunit
MLPSTGTITEWSAPDGPGVRLDAGVTTGSEVSVYYDPMLAKLIVFGSDRPHAIARMDRALSDFVITGVRANIPLLQWIVRDEWFREGKTTTSFLPQRLDESIFAARSVPEEASILIVAGLLLRGLASWRIGHVGMPIRLQSGDAKLIVDCTKISNDRWRLDGDVTGELVARAHGEQISAILDGETASGVVSINGETYTAHINGAEYRFAPLAKPTADVTGSVATGGAVDGRISSPMPGKIVKIAVREGEKVEEHALLLVLEAMKMEHRIEASVPSTVKSVLVKEGQIVSGGAPLVELG